MEEHRGTDAGTGRRLNADMLGHLALFRRMAEMSRHKREAAEQGDWDTLIEQEQAVTSIRRELVELEQREGSPALSDAEQEEKSRLIRQMLEDNDAVLERVRPWMSNTREQLGNRRLNRAVHDAYGRHLRPK